MQRRLLVKILGVSALLQFFTPAFAATGPSLKCTRIGQQIVWRDKKYTCIKSGKNLIWDKGVVIPTSTSTAKSSPASPTPTPTSKNPVAVEPTPTPSASKVPYAGTVVGKSSDLAMGESKILAEPDPYGRGFKFVVTRKSTGLVAFSNICTHEGCAVDVLAKNQLQCPCHGAQFDGATGAATRAPAYESLRAYRVEERSGQIVIWIY
jgi:nitrite reductase/ring-hydroxylating ferredoxin subunit